jgi:hypothetical protein
MRVFIVPYRNRLEHKTFFLNYLPKVVGECRVLFVHQCDNRPFNRGAMKNIGFLAVKALYPDTYGDIDLVFNDVDIMPYTEGVFHYETERGVVRHNYGYTSCLSASFVIKAADFEATNGFPNLWTWGLEDYLMQERVLARGLKIDRSRFRSAGSRAVLQLFDGMTRPMSVFGVNETRARHARDGVSAIKASFAVVGDMVEVSQFSCMYPPDRAIFEKDIRTFAINRK